MALPYMASFALVTFALAGFVTIMPELFLPLAEHYPYQPKPRPCFDRCDCRNAARCWISGNRQRDTWQLRTTQCRYLYHCQPCACQHGRMAEGEGRY